MLSTRRIDKEECCESKLRLGAWSYCLESVPLVVEDDVECFSELICFSNSNFLSRAPSLWSIGGFAFIFKAQPESSPYQQLRT